MGSIEDIQEQTDREFLQFLSDRLEDLQLEPVMEGLLKELEYHSQQWGDAHDQQHTPEDWVMILTKYMGKVAGETPFYKGVTYDSEKFKKRLIQVAAIAISAWKATGPREQSTDTE